MEGRFDDIQIEPTKAPAATTPSASAPAPVPPTATPAPAATAPAPAAAGKPAPAPAAPAPSPAATAAPAKSSGPATFGDAITHIMTEAKVTAAQAIARAVERYPALYSEWRKGDTSKFEQSKPEDPTKFPKLVASQTAQGKSKLAAIHYVIQTFPEAHASWLRFGDTSKL